MKNLLPRYNTPRPLKNRISPAVDPIGHASSLITTPPPPHVEKKYSERVLFKNSIVHPKQEGGEGSPSRSEDVEESRITPIVVQPHARRVARRDKWHCSFFEGGEPRCTGARGPSCKVHNVKR